MPKINNPWLPNWYDDVDISNKIEWLNFSWQQFNGNIVCVTSVRTNIWVGFSIFVLYFYFSHQNSCCFCGDDEWWLSPCAHLPIWNVRYGLIALAWPTAQRPCVCSFVCLCTLLAVPHAHVNVVFHVNKYNARIK